MGAPDNRVPRRMRSDAEKLAAEAQALVEIKAHLTVSVETGAAALGVGRDRMRGAIERGDIVGVKVGGETRLASAMLLGLLGLGPAAHREDGTS